MININQLSATWISWLCCTEMLVKIPATRPCNFLKNLPPSQIHLVLGLPLKKLLVWFFIHETTTILLFHCLNGAKLLWTQLPQGPCVGHSRKPIQLGIFFIINISWSKFSFVVIFFSSWISSQEWPPFHGIFRSKAFSIFLRESCCTCLSLSISNPFIFSFQFGSHNKQIEDSKQSNFKPVDLSVNRGKFAFWWMKITSTSLLSMTRRHQWKVSCLNNK